MAYGSTTIPLSTEVTRSSKTQTLIGVEAGGTGFRYDFKRLSSNVVENTAYLEFLGGHISGLLDGTQKTDWVSGVTSGIDLLGWNNKNVVKLLDSVPVYRTGTFSAHWDERALYSDWAVTTRVVVATLSGVRFSVHLVSNVRHDSVTAKIFKRTSEAEKFTYLEVDHVGAWSTSYVPQMMIDASDLLIDPTAVQVVGYNTTDTATVEAEWEEHVVHTSGQNIFLEFFPVDPATVAVKRKTNAGVWSDLSLETNLNTSEAVEAHCSLNNDLGVIQTGGYSAPDLVLKAAISDVATELTVYVDEALASYPPTGIITLGTEIILYGGKSSTGFIDLTRGYDGSTAAVHIAGVSIEDLQHGASAVGTVYIRYTAVPRVEYEVTNSISRSANSYPWLKLEPTVFADTNQIVQITPTDLNLSSIVLSTDRELIGGNLYGPVYYGTDTARLVATGYDYAENPVAGVELNIRKLSGPGYIGNRQTEIGGVSNSSGRFSGFFNAPITNDDLFVEVLSVVHNAGDTEMTLGNIPTGTVIGDVWVYQILKHDPLTGTVGVTVEPDSSDSAVAPYGNGWVRVHTPYSEKYVGGTIIWTDNAGVQYTATILRASEVTGGATPLTQFHVDYHVLGPSTITTGTARLFVPGAISWDPIAKNGVGVILYEWSTDVNHPITEPLTAGAWTPLRPDSIVGNKLIFTGRTLAVPAPFDSSSNLGGYKVIVPSESKFEAYGRDPFSGRMIVSNKLRLQLQLPAYLTGVDTTGVLPIPRGFTLVTQDYNVGAGVGGANFLTINPAATGIAQFSFTGVFS